MNRVYFNCNEAVHNHETDTFEFTLSKEYVISSLALKSVRVMIDTDSTTNGAAGQDIQLYATITSALTSGETNLLTTSHLVGGGHTNISGFFPLCVLSAAGVSNLDVEKNVDILHNAKGKVQGFGENISIQIREHMNVFSPEAEAHSHTILNEVMSSLEGEAGFNTNIELGFDIKLVEGQIWQN